MKQEDHIKELIDRIDEVLTLEKDTFSEVEISRLKNSKMMLKGEYENPGTLSTSEILELIAKLIEIFILTSTS